ncbi:MAG TPA: hypothetical protein VEY91_00660 [Candidatus Limnocylindria bacterium]|nr:hypothetical protein [Candidatus Limnocylindria bacterium]
MRAYTLTHLSDAVLLRDLAELVAQDRTTTAVLLAHLAEVDTRRLYLPAGYPSMHAYCVEGLCLSEDAALKRIQAARAARQFPALFTAVAEGRLHLTAVRLLAPHLTPENVDELLVAATQRRKAEIEQLLAQRFLRPEVPALVQDIPTLSNSQHAPGHVAAPTPDLDTALTSKPISAPRPEVAPLSPERFVLQLTIGKPPESRPRMAF